MERKEQEEITTKTKAYVETVPSLRNENHMQQCHLPLTSCFTVLKVDLERESYLDISPT